MPNSQVGTQLYQEKPPHFQYYTVRGGTYTEDDATVAEEEINEVEETFNVTMRNQGTNAKCDLYVQAGHTLNVGDVLPEVWNPANGAQPGGWTPRLFTVMKKQKKNFGKRALLFAVELIWRAALDATQVS